MPVDIGALTVAELGSIAAMLRVRPDALYRAIRVTARASSSAGSTPSAAATASIRATVNDDSWPASILR